MRTQDRGKDGSHAGQDACDVEAVCYDLMIKQYGPRVCLLRIQQATQRPESPRGSVFW